MKLTDQEQVILRAIDQVRRGDVASISDVIKAVGYSKATVKKVLVRLNEKGIVALHRHDWPASLKPEQRKLMVRIGHDYFNAVSMRKRNPTKSKGKTALKKTGRALKGFARGALSAGSEILGAGAMALNPHGMSEKTWKAEENKFRKSITAYRAKGWTLKQIKDRLWLTYGLTLQSLSDDKAVFVDPFHRGGGFTLDLNAPKRGRKTPNPTAKLSRWKTLEKKEQLILKQLYRLVERDYHKATTDQQRRALLEKKWGLEGRLKEIHKERQKLFERGEVNPARRIKIRNKYIDLVIKGQAKKTPQGWRVGKKTFAQGRGTVNVSSGYYLDKATGLVYAKRARNSARFSSSQWANEMARLRDIKPRPLVKMFGKSGGTPEQRAKREAEMREWNRQYRHASKMQKIALEEDNAAFRARQAQNKTKKKRNASRTVHLARKTKPSRAGVSRKTVHKTKALRSVATRRKVATKRITRNPSAESIRKTFAGRVTGERDVFVPSATPKGKLAKLGNLVLIKTEQGVIKPVRGSAVLLADTRGKLHIGTTSKSDLFSGPRQSFGHVKRIEYEGSKPHLGFPNPIIWHHRMGEETGHRPTLHADGRGGLVFRGGRYRLTRRGVEN